MKQLDDTFPCTAREIEIAATLIRSGGVVAFPTETVYGLGADARNDQAVRRIFQIKGRPADHPLIVHLASLDELESWAQDIPEDAFRLADAFWPGPLTLVLHKKPEVPDVVTGGQSSVAVRAPAHPVALALIRETGGLAAPSANRFGRISPTRAEHVHAELGEKVDGVLDGGPCAVGVESTIVSLLEEPVVLRPGGVTVIAIERILGHRVQVRDSYAKVRTPGNLPAHYAPRTPLELLPADVLWQRTLALSRMGRRVAVMTVGAAPWERYELTGIHCVVMPAEAEAYAQRLYADLRALDAAGFDALLMQTPPDEPEWLAVRDRLQRASYSTGRS